MKYASDLDLLSEYFYQVQQTENKKLLQAQYLGKFESELSKRAFRDFIGDDKNVLRSSDKAIERVTVKFMENAGYRRQFGGRLFESMAKSQSELHKGGIPNVSTQEKLATLDKQSKEINELKTTNSSLLDQLKEALNYKNKYTNLVSNLVEKEGMDQSKIEKYSETPAKTATRETAHTKKADRNLEL